MRKREAGRKAPRIGRSFDLQFEESGRFNLERDGLIKGPSLFFWVPPSWEARPLRIEVWCVPRRSWATLLLEDGLTQNIPRKTAFQLIEFGELEVVKKKPLTVSIPKHKDFAEEQRYCSGRRIPGVAKGLFNGKSSISAGIRCKPPRSATNQAYVHTIGWVREAQRKAEIEYEKEQEKLLKDLERKEKKKNKKRRKRMRNLLIALLFICPVLGQAEQVSFPSPFFWDANTDNATEYGVYSSPASCVDPAPSPANCVAFSQVATVPHVLLTICTPDCITWTDPGPVTFGQSIFYRVTALNSSGGESAFSDELEVEWLEPIPGIPGKPRTATTLTFIIREKGKKVAEVVGKFYSGPGGLRTNP